MAYVEKIKTWADNWNDVIRKIIFPDQKLKDLMQLPKDTSIIQFVDRYFIEDVSPDELVVNEKVRIAYYDERGRDFGTKKVRNHYKNFDIFVKEDALRNATNDRLKLRYNLIAERLKYLLLKDYHICNLHFDYEDEYDMWTKVVGYKRYRITFEYKTTV